MLNLKWYKCPYTKKTYSSIEVFDNLMVIPNQFNYHLNISTKDKINFVLDDNSFNEKDTALHTADPLNFIEKTAYKDKIKTYSRKNILSSVRSGSGSINNLPVQIVFFDFTFLGGSIGSLEGEKVTRCVERSILYKEPLLIFSTSSGARMHEGVFSLCQLAKTNASLKKLRLSNVPYISILGNPCMGGAMASFASIGDFVIAEPDSLIGFAGPRVIKSTISTELPEGFQTSKFLLSKGLVDKVVSRKLVKGAITKILESFYK
ncbi:MAG: acetyl-CoA carboxylase carboxyltransferase subunit beta [Candidatus Organicella extenuata]|uniref:Acetyl-CoA carboxylase carboxyltransferase subunit beta n=1 Tax=Candidatus Organicella extenuata TaxID=2841811 RepID=A0AA51GGU5_9BACT|nr:MAG: acetyl-CoA carboxylase carboxyltransferase subunit beta [Candidatus Organicella extenuata]